MANDEHLAIFKKGVDTWNEWRGENPDILPDLCNADLDDEDLSEANLSGVDLTGAYLHRAGLLGGNLRAARLSGADFLCASLFGAWLENTDLGEARNLTKGQVLSTETDSTTVLPDHLKAEDVQGGRS